MLTRTLACTHIHTPARAGPRSGPRPQHLAATPLAPAPGRRQHPPLHLARPACHTRAERARMGMATCVYGHVHCMTRDMTSGTALFRSPCMPYICTAHLLILRLRWAHVSVYTHTHIPTHFTQAYTHAQSIGGARCACEHTRGHTLICPNARRARARCRRARHMHGSSARHTSQSRSAQMASPLQSRPSSASARWLHSCALQGARCSARPGGGGRRVTCQHARHVSVLQTPPLASHNAPKTSCRVA